MNTRGDFHNPGEARNPDGAVATCVTSIAEFTRAVASPCPDGAVRPQSHCVSVACGDTNNGANTGYGNGGDGVTFSSISHLSISIESPSANTALCLCRGAVHA